MGTLRNGPERTTTPEKLWLSLAGRSLMLLLSYLSLHLHLSLHLMPNTLQLQLRRVHRLAAGLMRLHGPTKK
jgi:hypothetical protein